MIFFVYFTVHRIIQYYISVDFSVLNLESTLSKLKSCLQKIICLRVTARIRKSSRAKRTSLNRSPDPWANSRYSMVIFLACFQKKWIEKTIDRSCKIFFLDFRAFDRIDLGSWNFCQHQTLKMRSPRVSASFSRSKFTVVLILSAKSSSSEGLFLSTSIDIISPLLNPVLWLVKNKNKTGRSQISPTRFQNF